MSPAHRRPDAPRAASQLNRPLVVGLGLVLLLLALGVTGPWLAPHDPNEHVRIARDAAGVWHKAPFAPLEMAGHPLGTDWDGRDILSRLLWAFRPTLLIAGAATFLRVSLALIVGTMGGWYVGARGALAQWAIDVASALPLLIAAVLLLFLTGGEHRAWQMALAVSATGWASTAALVRVQVRGIRGEAYIEAARSLGADDGFIFRRHVLPSLRRLLPVLAAFEMGGVLLLLAELGFLGFFLDGGLNRFVARGDTAGAWAVRTAGTPELGQLLSGGWQNFYQTPWLALWGGAAFLLAVVGFMTLGEGLKRRLERR